MSSTLTNIVIHIIFSTKNRAPQIKPEFADRLYSYIGGIARNLDCDLIAAGGIEDHVHLLVAFHPTVAVSDFLRDVKANSSKWLHEDLKVEFEWQRGFAAFSVSESNIPEVRAYIANQREHHTRRTYDEELVAFLERHNVKFDRMYLLG
ncbi:MAG: IS200/IS605 family transposase [Phycisphaerales bacterium]|nr:IS200/IS605 family transposase [Phycisphaerales bacterium]